jgi:hypothetical protein
MATEIQATSHVHSSWSYDGSWSLKALADKFSSRGSRVLMMTEHDRGFTAERLAEYREACAQASSPEILVVPGIEYSDAANRVHVLVWGPVPFLGEGLPTGEMLQGVREAGGVAVLAHPTRREVWKSFDPKWSELLLGIEAWNRKYDGWAPSHTAPALIEAARAVPFVGLDFHTERQLFQLNMMLEIEQAVTEASVLNCLRARRCAARAFGLPLSGTPVRAALPVLGVAERGRRMAAMLVKRSKGSASGNKQAPAKQQ